MKKFVNYTDDESPVNFLRLALVYSVDDLTVGLLAGLSRGSVNDIAALLRIEILLFRSLRATATAAASAHSSVN